MEIQDLTPTTDSTETSVTPPTLKVREVPAAIEARNALLEAIAEETRAVRESRAGSASGALLELAQAYALLSTASVPVSTGGDSAVVPVQGRAGGHQVGLCLELEP